MIDRSDGFGGSKGRVARVAAATLAALGLLSGGAMAGVVKFPKDNPKITLDVPDDWSVDMTATGLELHSPEKNSIIVAQTTVRKKAIVEAWTKEAVAKLEAFGIAFEEKGKSPAKPKVAEKPATTTPPPPPSSLAAPVASAKPAEPAAPSASAVTSGSPSAPSSPVAPPAAPAFTFSGAPSLEIPGAMESQKKVDPGQFSLEALSGFDGKVRRSPKLQYKTVKYLGSMKDGKPVDVELAIYTLSDQRVFLLMQESEPADNRSVAIAESLRGTKDSAK